MEEHQGGHGGDAAHGGQDLAHPEGTPVEAVHPQALDHGPAQAVPGAVAQGDLSVIGPLGIQEVQDQEARKIPQAFIQEGGVVVFPLARHRIEQAHAGEGHGRRAEGLPVEEVAPAAHKLADEEAHNHQVQQCGQGAFFDAAIDGNAYKGSDDCTVDGKTAVPDVQHGDGIVGVVRPAEHAVINSGADDGKGRDPEDAVENVVLGQPGPLAAAAAIDPGQQQTKGNDHAVQVDGQGPDIEVPDGIDLNSQQRERDCGIVGRI